MYAIRAHTMDISLGILSVELDLHGLKGHFRLTTSVLVLKGVWPVETLSVHKKSIAYVPLGQEGPKYQMIPLSKTY